jgi:hypothetical protein
VTRVHVVAGVLAVRSVTGVGFGRGPVRVVLMPVMRFCHRRALHRNFRDRGGFIFGEASRIVGILLVILLIVFIPDCPG